MSGRSPTPPNFWDGIVVALLAVLVTWRVGVSVWAELKLWGWVK